MHRNLYFEIQKYDSLKEAINLASFLSDNNDPEYKINEFTQKNPLNYDIIAEGRWIAEKFGITGYPSNIVVDKKGVIQFYDVGYKSDIVERLSYAIDKN